jgi:hypothetical protein
LTKKMQQEGGEGDDQSTLDIYRKQQMKTTKTC